MRNTSTRAATVGWLSILKLKGEKLWMKENCKSKSDRKMRIGRVVCMQTTKTLERQAEGNSIGLKKKSIKS